MTSAACIWVVSLVLVLVTACDVAVVDGSGNLVTENRDVGPFTRIDARGGANVELSADSGLSQSVSVIYDDNVIDFVVTEVDGDTLVIDTRGSFRTSGGLRRVVVVETDVIEVITTRDGADVSGSGMVDSYRLRASDGSDVDLLDLRASSVEVDASGGTEVLVSPQSRSRSMRPVRQMSTYSGTRPAWLSVKAAQPTSDCATEATIRTWGASSQQCRRRWCP